MDGGAMSEKTMSEVELPPLELHDEDRNQRWAGLGRDINVSHAELREVHAIRLCRERQLREALQQLAEAKREIAKWQDAYKGQGAALAAALKVGLDRKVRAERAEARCAELDALVIRWAAYKGGGEYADFDNGYDSAMHSCARELKLVLKPTLDDAAKEARG